MSRLDGATRGRSADLFMRADGAIANFVHQVRLSLLMSAAICLTFAAIAAAAISWPIRKLAMTGTQPRPAKCACTMPIGR